jgi:hypothetical protein
VYYFNVDDSQSSVTEYEPTHWPFEVALRIAASLILFSLPYLSARVFAKRPLTQ